MQNSVYYLSNLLVIVPSKAHYADDGYNESMNKLLDYAVRGRQNRVPVLLLEIHQAVFLWKKFYVPILEWK